MKADLRPSSEMVVCLSKNICQAPNGRPGKLVGGNSRARADAGDGGWWW